MRVITYAEAIREALDHAMTTHRNAVVIGEGVPDPKGIFGTTLGLREKYGEGRVLDMPLAENGMTGVCIGAALNGLRPILIHQRIDFSLLSLDQLINNAAKWRYMFDGQAAVPLVVRVIIGRGWGQGPQHSQNLQQIFAQTPGLKVVAPVTAQDAKGMLIAAIADDDPVIFIEHRWVHGVRGEVPEGGYERPLTGAAALRVGNDITIAAFSQMAVEALRASDVLAEHGIDAEVIDMRVLNPLDVDSVLASARKTSRLVVADTASDMASLGHTVISKVIERGFGDLKAAPRLVAQPDHPVPTSHHVAAHYYRGALAIAAATTDLLGIDSSIATEIARKLAPSQPSDVPAKDFLGPF